MYIIEVIPLTTLPSQVPQLLSYFFNQHLKRGSIVEVFINNRRSKGVVVSSLPVEGQKIILKKSDFQLKKISSVINARPQVNHNQFKIALWLSKNYYAPLSLCLKAVLPAFFFKKKYELQITPSSSDKNHEPIAPSLEKSFFILCRAKDILKNLRPLIQKELRQKKQILLIVPELSTLQYFYDILAGYYETAVIYGSLSNKELFRNWKNIQSGDAEIIIGTRLALFAPFKNLGLIIVEDPANQAYKSDMTPKYITPDLAKYIAYLYRAKLTFIASALDVKNYFAIKNTAYQINHLLPKSRPLIIIADMLTERKSGNFSLFSRKASVQIFNILEKNKKVLIFSSRKGYSGTFLCDNCGLSIQCSRCSIPLRVHKIPESVLLCPRCSEKKKIPEICPNCNSYKLKAVGLPGSQKIYEALTLLCKNWPKQPLILILDSALVKTPGAEKTILEKMGTSEPLIVIATQMIFSHRYSQHFDLIVVPNTDGLTYMPDFKTEEELMYQFQKLLDFDPKQVLLQTFNHNNYALSVIATGHYDEFYERELASRQLFFYPPFSRLVKLSLRHTDQPKALYASRILSEKLKMAILQKKLQDNIKLLGPSPAFIEKEKNFYIYNIILKIAPEEKLENILKFVPTNWSIDVDPKSVLQ